MNRNNNITNNMDNFVNNTPLVNVTDSVEKNGTVYNKILYKELNLNYLDFSNCELFYNRLHSLLILDTQYSIICRVSYINNKSNVENKLGRDITQHKMLGNQVGFFGSTVEDVNDFALNYYQTIVYRLENSMDIYNYRNLEILGLQFIIYTIGENSKQRLQKFSVSSLGKYKELLNVSKTSVGYNSLLPLVCDTGKFGILLNKHIVDGIEYVTLIDGTSINWLELINRSLPINKKCTHLDPSILFYQNKIKDRDVMITVKTLDGINYIQVYTLNGMLITSVVDEKLDSQTFSRSIGNVKTFINNTGIYKKDINVDFPPIYTYEYKGRYSRMLQPEWKVGTLDLETYKLDEDNYKTYALGFHVKNHTETFYIDNKLDSDGLIMECINSMLKDNYNGYTFYVHNLARYDIYFILPVLYRYSEMFPGRYTINLIFRDTDIISFSISTKLNKKNVTITISDSYTLLQSSLDNLCKTFNPKVKKSIFPYTFITKNTLFYEGNKPGIKYYNNISEDQYNLIDKNWSTRDQTIQYLQNDLVSLYDIIDSFKNSVYMKYHTHITKSLTISSLSLDIFLRRYYENNIPLIKQKTIYDDIKLSYYGGITEVYKPFGKKLYYYDVNSLYPYSALNSMPGLKCTFSDSINKSFKEVEDSLFGFFYCKIDTNDSYLGLLPYRGKQGLVMPLGNFEGWYFSEELKFAYQNGYKIVVLYGYQFEKSENVFKKYVEELYEIKSTATDKVRRTIAKSMLNNLLGRFGLDINKYETSLVSPEEYQDIIQTRNVRSSSAINDRILVSYSKDISEEICTSHNLDYRSVLSDRLFSKSDKSIGYKEDSFKDVSVAISSATTSYSRIYMSKIKLAILAKGGSIYYTDTDSIITDIRLDDELVGTEIGKFKLEHEIEEGYFISNKTYAFKTINGEYILKNKGIFNKSLNYDSFKDLYKGKSVKGYRFESIKDYSKGSVIINSQRSITLSPNSYTKRVKIFNNGLWVDTKPIKINSINSNQYHTTIHSPYKKFNLISFIYKIPTFLSYFSFWFFFWLCIVGYILCTYDEQEENIPLDIEGIEDNVTEINLGIEDIEMDKDINDKRISIWDEVKQEWNYFLTLFSKDINKDYNKDIFVKNDINTKLYNTDSGVKKDVEVFKNIIDAELSSSNTKIDMLEDKVAVLEYQLQESKMNTNKLIDSLLKDLADIPSSYLTENIKSLQNSPHLENSQTLWTNAPLLKSKPFPPSSSNFSN